jgi:hypothetical protein
MALTPEQIAAAIEDIGESIPVNLETAINNAAQVLINEIKNNPNFPVDTGALRDSLSVRLIDNQYFGISMADYGFYQNYGVKGTNNATHQFGVPEEVSAFLPPREGSSTYWFNPKNKMIGGDLPFGVRVAIHRNGLNGKQFFDINELVDRMAELINENLDL